MIAINTQRPIRKSTGCITARRKAKTVKIPLSKGMFAIVDKADEEIVRRHRWFASKTGKKHYAKSGPGNKGTYMHRLIIPSLPGFLIDHKDGNTLNNTRENLRVCTKAQNMVNSPGWRRKFGKYKAVVWVKSKRKWRVCLEKNGKKFDFGYYDSEIVAACVADDAYAMLWGEFAWLNFPKMVPRNFLRRFIKQSKGRIMTVTFYKRSAVVNGEGRKSKALRTMRCRVGVSRGVKGAGLAFDPNDKNLIGVYDMKKRCYRFIPIEGVLCLTYRGKRYRVTPDPLPYTAA